MRDSSLSLQQSVKLVVSRGRDLKPQYKTDIAVKLSLHNILFVGGKEFKVIEVVYVDIVLGFGKNGKVCNKPSRNNGKT